MTGILAASENQLSRASRSVVLLCRERDEPHWRPPDHARLYLLPDAGLHSISGKESHLRGRPIGYGRLRLISNPKKTALGHTLGVPSCGRQSSTFDRSLTSIYHPGWYIYPRSRLPLTTSVTQSAAAASISRCTFYTQSFFGRT